MTGELWLIVKLYNQIYHFLASLSAQQAVASLIYLVISLQISYQDLQTNTSSRKVCKIETI